MHDKTFSVTLLISSIYFSPFYKISVVPSLFDVDSIFGKKNFLPSVPCDLSDLNLVLYYNCFSSFVSFFHEVVIANMVFNLWKFLMNCFGDTLAFMLVEFFLHIWVMFSCAVWMCFLVSLAFWYLCLVAAKSFILNQTLKTGLFFQLLLY